MVKKKLLHCITTKFYFKSFLIMKKLFLLSLLLAFTMTSFSFNLESNKSEDFEKQEKVLSLDLESHCDSYVLQSFDLNEKSQAYDYEKSEARDFNLIVLFKAQKDLSKINHYPHKHFKKNADVFNYLYPEYKINVFKITSESNRIRCVTF